MKGNSYKAKNNLLVTCLYNNFNSERAITLVVLVLSLNTLPTSKRYNTAGPHNPSCQQLFTGHMGSHFWGPTYKNSPHF